jgi:hypothetical protein
MERVQEMIQHDETGLLSDTVLPLRKPTLPLRRYPKTCCDEQPASVSARYLSTLKGAACPFCFFEKQTRILSGIEERKAVFPLRTHTV